MKKIVPKRVACGLPWCSRPLKWDGLCEPHGLIFDWWGCERGGYEVYIKRGKRAGRAAFRAYLFRLGESGQHEVLALMHTNDHTDAGLSKAKMAVVKKYGLNTSGQKSTASLGNTSRTRPTASQTQ